MSFAPKNSKPTSPALRQQASSRKLSIGSSASSPGDGRKKSQEFESDGLLEAKNAEIEALKQRIEKYDADQKKLGPYMAEVRRGQAENDKMKKEVHELKMKLAEVDHIKERAVEIESERRAFERQKKGLENEIEVLRSRCERAENEQAKELENFFEKLREEEKRNNALEERMLRQAREMEEKLVKAAQFEADESLVKEIESLQRRNQDLEERQKRHDESMKLMEREREKIESRLHDAESDRIESSRFHQENEVSLKRELADTKRELDLARHTIDVIGSKVKEGELEDSSSRAAHNSEEILRSTEERSERERLRIESLRNECRGLEESRSSLNSDIARAKKALAVEEKELREHRAQAMSDMMAEVERKRQELMKELNVEISNSREQARMLVQRASLKSASQGTTDAVRETAAGDSTGEDLSYVQSIELQVRCEQLTNENRTLRKESDRLRILTADLESLRFDFAGENKRYVSRIKELDGELKHVKEIYAEAIREKKTSDDEKMELEARLDRMAAQRSELSAQVDELIDELQSLKLIRQSEMEQVLTSEKELKELEEAQSKLQALCDAQKEELSSFRSVVSNRIEKLVAHCTEHGDPSGFSSTIAAKGGAESMTMESVLDLYDRELIALSSKSRRQALDLEKLENDKSRLSQELDSLRASIATQSRTAAAEMDNSRLRQEIDKLRGGLNNNGAGVTGQVNNWTDSSHDSFIASPSIAKTSAYPGDAAHHGNRYSHLASAKGYGALAKARSYFDYSHDGPTPRNQQPNAEARRYIGRDAEPGYVDRLLEKAISMNESMHHLVVSRESPKRSQLGDTYRSPMKTWPSNPSSLSLGGSHALSTPGQRASSTSPVRSPISPTLHTPMKW